MTFDFSSSLICQWSKIFPEKARKSSRPSIDGAVSYIFLPRIMCFHLCPSMGHVMRHIVMPRGRSSQGNLAFRILRTILPSSLASPLCSVLFLPSSSPSMGHSCHETCPPCAMEGTCRRRHVSAHVQLCNGRQKRKEGAYRHTGCFSEVERLNADAYARSCEDV